MNALLSFADKKEYQKISRALHKTFTFKEHPVRLDTSFCVSPMLNYECSPDYMQDYMRLANNDDTNALRSFSVLKYKMMTMNYTTHAAIFSDMIALIKTHIHFHISDSQFAQLYSAINAKLLLDKWYIRLQTPFPTVYVRGASRPRKHPIFCLAHTRQIFDILNCVQHAHTCHP